MRRILHKTAPAAPAVRLAAMRAIDRTTGIVLAEHMVRADGFLARLVGLLGRAALREGEGLLLVPCSSIHTLGMRFAIDVLFLDGQGEVLRAVEALPPWRVPSPVRGTRMVLELPAGTLARTATAAGNRVEFAAGRLACHPPLR
jgi:uncharacterized protein